MTGPRSPKRLASSARKKEATVSFASAGDWSRWLATHHASSKGVWLKLAKKGAAGSALNYAEALDVALAWGWIDSQKQAHDDSAWLQRFTPRGPRSPWSKINRDKATALIAAGRMEAPGLAEVQRAQQDGRWDAAYDSARTSTVPEDLEAALAANTRAAAFFSTLDGANRYAILYRVQTAKKPETRARRIAEFVAMLARHETLHPARRATTARRVQ
ncbi:YdeI/OmpD-associated family protein [Archangium sp.]|uniref:YdeI/OmpD-associated family protein n=1 Tax=Archangium sp. TaxID=1872627 RepID=UPI00389A739D